MYVPDANENDIHIIRSQNGLASPKLKLISLAFLLGAAVFTFNNASENVDQRLTSLASVNGNLIGEEEQSLYNKVKSSYTLQFLTDTVVYLFGVRDPEYPIIKRDRTPKNGRKIQVDFLNHPIIARGLQDGKKSDDAGLVAMCSGPKNLLDIWIDESAYINDLMIDPTESYTAFGLDCRKPRTHYAFLVVLDGYGNIVNARPMARRSESVNFYNTTTLLAAAQDGLWLWNYATDVLEPLQFAADTHSLVYRNSEDRFYGCYPDKQAVTMHNPNTLCSFDGVTGKTLLDGDKTQFAWSDIEAHFNYITLNGDDIYVSERTRSALKKVNMKTQEVEWVFGGLQSDFQIFDANGKEYHPKVVGGRNDWTTFPFMHQHKFQHLDDQYFSLLDNNIGEKHYRFVEKPWGLDSRMLIYYVDQENKVAYEAFSYPMGDLARSYGGTDILPSGNVLGSSYVEWVHPQDPDHQYHQNIWEVNPAGQVVWRASFKGLNIVSPENTQDPYPRFYQDVSEKEMERHPVGWNIYNVERGYPRPIISRPCRMGENGVLFIPFNTIRAQEDYPGIAGLYTVESRQHIASVDFLFHKSFLPRPQILVVPEGFSHVELKIVLVNHWREHGETHIGSLDSLQACPERDVYRKFYPKYM